MCWKKRKTIEVTVCALSGGLPNRPYCPEEKRRFYVDPRPGEAAVPTTACVIHVAPVPPDPPDPPPPPEPTVTIQVCAASLKLPNAYCPTKINKTFVVGQEPTTVCAVHVEPPPRLAVYIGALDLMGATGDWKAFLGKAKSAGAAGVRIVVCYSWQSAQPISPYLQVGTWTHETTGDVFPLYRLSAWNPAFWTKLRDVLSEMKRLKLTAWLVAEDYCSLKGNKDVKYFNPFYCSEEAFSPSTPGGVWGTAMGPYHRALFAKIVNTANASGCAYRFEVMNETSIVDGTDAEIIAWNEWAHESMAGLGVPKLRLIASPGQAQAAAIAAQVGIFSPHQIGRPEDVKAIAGVNVTKTLFSSDGFKQGTGPDDGEGKRGVGLDVADSLARRIISVGAVGYELFDRGIWHDDNCRANLDDFNPAVLKRMAFNK